MSLPSKNSMWRYVGEVPDCPEGVYARNVLHRVIQSNAREIITWSEGGLAWQTGWSFLGSPQDFFHQFTPITK